MFRSDFDIGSATVLLAALLWIGSFSLIVFVAQTVGRALQQGSRIPLLLIAGLAGLQTAAFLLIYIGSFVSNRLWGDNLTYSIVETAVRNPAAALSLLGIDGTSVLAVFILPSAVAIVALAIAAVWFGVLRLSAGSLNRNLLAAPPTRALASFACCAIVSLGLIHFAPRAARGEPVLDFFEATSSRNMLDWNPERMIAALEARKSELEYPPQRTDVPRKNVIVILSDSIRADHLHAYGYPQDTTPFLSQLVESKKALAVYPMMSTCSDSYCGIASMLSSLPFHKISPETFKLNSVLKRAGYRTSYYLSGTHRDWRFLWDFYGHEIDDMRDCVGRNCSDTNDDSQLVADMQRMEPFDGQPRFFFIFLMSSHWAGTKIGPFKPAATASNLDLIMKRKLEKPDAFDEHGVPVYRPITPEQSANLQDAYNKGISQADDMVRQIFGVLEEKGYLRDSIAVFSSDHGESLGEFGNVAHGVNLYQRDIGIPLIIYDAELAAYRGKTYAAQVDIAPTLLDRLGLPIPASWDGVPLTRSDVPRSSVHQTRMRDRPCAASVLQTDDKLLKYIRCRGPGPRISEELFDLREDKDESHNIIASASAEQVAAFRAKVAHLIDDLECSGGGQTRYCAQRKSRRKKAELSAPD